MDLLQQLLDYLASGQARTMAELARKLDVGPDLLAQMLRDLERAGYVRQVAAGCSDGCAHCASAGECGLHSDGRIWSVTPKAFKQTQR